MISRRGGETTMFDLSTKSRRPRSRSWYPFIICCRTDGLLGVNAPIRWLTHTHARARAIVNRHALLASDNYFHFQFGG